MWCLWNGEYGEHDLSFAPALETTLRIQEEQYKQYIGCVVGDFTCVKVEYDWGRRDQRWTVRCNLCGKESYQYHVKDWRRGKGRKTTCDCRKEQKLRDRLREKEAAKNARVEKIAQDKKEHLGKTYGEWKVIEYEGLSSCRIECTVCGASKNAKIGKVLAGDIVPCSHKKPNDYSDEKWIGRRAGHLTVIGRSGSSFIARCDCGREITERPTELFRRRIKTTCGSPECEYATEAQRKARKSGANGHGYEQTTVEMLKSLGYNAKRTKGSADFGVDVIITEDDGTLFAVQCKKKIAPAGVKAIQEVYAGGRFYNCTKFAVICDSGFSSSAIIMARKLGVYLCEGEFDPPDDIWRYADNLLPVYRRMESLEKLYELNGERHTLADWCAIYGVSQTTVRNKLKGEHVSLEVALKTSKEQKEERVQSKYTVRGVTGSLAEVCNNFGVIPQTAAYRMKQKGMTLEEAIFAPKGPQS